MDTGFSIDACNEQRGALVFGELCISLYYKWASRMLYVYIFIFSFNVLYPWKEDGTGKVFIVGARGAHGLELPIASEVFEESGRSLVRGTLDYLQGLKVVI
jgi:hypothetical protein